MFEKLYHHRFGNERSHSSRHDYGTQDAAERMSYHSVKAALSLVASVELLALLAARAAQYVHR